MEKMICANCGFEEVAPNKASYRRFDEINGILLCEDCQQIWEAWEEVDETLLKEVDETLLDEKMSNDPLTNKQIKEAINEVRETLKDIESNTRYIRIVMGAVVALIILWFTLSIVW